MTAPGETAAGATSWPRAFEQAEQVRAGFADIVADVAERGLSLEQAFSRADAEPLVGRIFAVKVFEVIPGVGKVRARRTMASVGLADDVALRDVGAGERAQLAAAFSEP